MLRLRTILSVTNRRTAITTIKQTNSSSNNNTGKKKVNGRGIRSKDKRFEADLSNDSAAANLAGESGGRIIYNGFTFDLRDISSIKYIN